MMYSMTVSRKRSRAILRAKTGLLAAASSAAIVFSLASPAQSQETAQANNIEEVVVTGSRIVRDGYEAPTPLTVVNAAALSEAATGNVAAQLNTMPVFSGS